MVYEKAEDRKEFPILAIELDDKEHFEDEIVKKRDNQKNEICRQQGFELIRVKNSYARRYNYIKNILIDFSARIRYKLFGKNTDSIKRQSADNVISVDLKSFLPQFLFRLSFPYPFHVPYRRVRKYLLLSVSR